jgi:gas vesicle protein
MLKENGYSKGLVKGFLVGGTIVGIAALFFAPKSGKELRKNIRTKSNKYLDNAEKIIAEGKMKAKDLVDSGMKIFSDAKTKTGSMVLSGKEFVDNEKDKLKTAYKAGVDAYSETKNQNDGHSQV